jgi:hypothetical protein
MRRGRRDNTVSWEAAISNINQMERAVVNVMVKPGDLTHNDVLDCVVQPEPLGLLRAAFPHSGIGTVHDNARDYEFAGGKVTLYFDFVAMNVVPPKKSVMDLQHTAPKINQFNTMMDKLLGICSQHAKLRRILRKFDLHRVTVGAARHYWPTLQSLLPGDHAFFAVKGDRFKDVDFDYETIELLREAPEIVAKGLLCEPAVNGEYKKGKVLIRAMVGSQMHYLFMGA